LLKLDGRSDQRQLVGWQVRLQADATILAAFVALSLLIRLPTFILPSTHWDEGLFWVIAAEINQGHLPYVTAWDRKPVGIFLIYALVDRTFADPSFGIRLVGSLFVAIGAFALYRLARLAFARGGLIGLVAGTSFILFSLLPGGLEGSAEVFYVPITLVGLTLLLKPVIAAPDGRLSAQAWPLFCGSLIVGIALQIKYSVLFDMLAFALAYLILTSASISDRMRWLRRAAIVLAIGALGASLPTLAVMSVYAVGGHFEAFWTANVVANAGYGAVPFGSLTIPLGIILKQGPLWFAAGLALMLGPRLAREPRDVRMLGCLAVWLLCILAGIAYLRMLYQAYFFQLLPPLCLLTGYLVVRGAVERMEGATARLLSLSLLAATTFFAMVTPWFVLAAYFALERLQTGDPLWGDNVARIARDLSPEVNSANSIYVYDYHPGLYHRLGQRPPSTVVSPDHLFVGAYGLVDSEAELATILDGQPAFVVVRLEARPGLTPDDQPERHRLDEVLYARLSQAYELYRVYPVVYVRFESRPELSMGRWGAQVYRRRSGGER
jgi:hypothetical protein